MSCFSFKALARLDDFMIQNQLQIRVLLINGTGKGPEAEAEADRVLEEEIRRGLEIDPAAPGCFSVFAS